MMLLIGIADPELSFAVFQEALDVLVVHGAGAGDFDEDAVFVVQDAAGMAHPDAARRVEAHGFKVRASVFGVAADGLELALGVGAESLHGGNPKGAAGVAHDAVERVAGQSVLPAEVLELEPVKAVEAIALGGDPEVADLVLGKMPLIRLDQAVLGAVGGEFVAVVFADADPEVGKPEVALAVLKDVHDDVAEQAVGGIEDFEVVAVKTVDPAAVGAKPQVAPAVLTDRHDLCLGQPIIYVEVREVVCLPKPWGLHHE